MSEEQELAAAAASGAAAAVETVQDQQATEQATEAAVVAADMAAEAATDAREVATEAVSEASVAAAVAADAQQTAEATAIGLSDVYQRIEQVKTEVVEEVRGFFANLEAKMNPSTDNSVQKVEVTHTDATAQTDNGNTGPENSQQGQTDGSGQGTTSQKRDRPRHKFGR